MSIFNTYMETDDLLIRNIKNSDQPFLLRFFDEAPMAVRYHELCDAKQIARFISWANPKVELANHNKWMITSKVGQIPVGTVGFNGVYRDRKSGELGIELLKDFQNQNTLRQVMEKVLLFGFKKLMLDNMTLLVPKTCTHVTLILAELGFLIQGHEKRDNHLYDLLTINSLGYDQFLEKVSTYHRQQFKKSTLIFPTTDLIQTATFYTTYLGFTAMTYYADDYPYVHLFKDDVAITLLHSNLKTVIPNHLFHENPTMHDAFFMVKDVDSLKQKLLKDGIPIVEDHHLTKYATKAFTIEDCDGRWIGFGTLI